MIAYYAPAMTGKVGAASKKIYNDGKSKYDKNNAPNDYCCFKQVAAD
jgi:hypothetical protein